MSFTEPSSYTVIVGVEQRQNDRAGLSTRHACVNTQQIFDPRHVVTRRAECGTVVFVTRVLRLSYDEREKERPVVPIFFSSACRHFVTTA